MLDEVKALLFEAFKKSHQIKDRSKKRRLTTDLKAMINMTFKDKALRIEMRNISKGVEAKGSGKKKKSSRGFDGLEEYVPGKTQTSQRSKTSTPRNVVTDNDKPEAKKKAVATDDNILDIVKLDNQGIIDHFGGIGNVKKFAKIQALEINYRLKGDEYLNPFREALMKLAGIEHDSEVVGKDNDKPGAKSGEEE